MHMAAYVHSSIPASYQLESISNWDTPNIIGIITLIELCLNSYVNTYLAL